MKFTPTDIFALGLGSVVGTLLLLDALLADYQLPDGFFGFASGLVAGYLGLRLLRRNHRRNGGTTTNGTDT